ncbi:MAG: TolC family protein [Gammaproteobacteria bacterium]
MPRLTPHWRYALSILMPFWLSACATYQAAPLPQAPDLASAPHDAQGLTLHTLSLAQTARIAVRDNPDLRAARRKVGISAAQLYDARLIPDPQLGYALDHPTSKGPGLVNAYNVGLSEDIRWLLTRGSHVDAARAARTRQRLEVAWQAWQVSQQAQSLYIRLWSLNRQAHLLEQQQHLYARRQQAATRALQAGNITLDTLSADLVTLTDTESQLARTRRQLTRVRMQLNALLGLQPAADWQIKTPQPPQPPSEMAVRQALARLPDTRPDLLALQAGYKSADARYRAAVLGQFPSLNIGVTRASDTSGVLTTGLGITLNLPIFNGNRGQVAVTRATRDQLRGAYQARLDHAYSQVRMLLARLQDIEATRRRLETRLPELRRVADRAARAFASGNLGGASYIAVQSSYLAHEREAIGLDQSLMEGAVALHTLLGYIPAGAPAVASTSSAPKGEHP